MDSKADPSRWAVSKGKNRALAKPLLEDLESRRLNTLANTIVYLNTEEEVI